MKKRINDIWVYIITIVIIIGSFFAGVAYQKIAQKDAVSLGEAVIENADNWADKMVLDTPNGQWFVMRMD